MNQEKFISGLEQEFLAKLDDEMVKGLIIMGDFNADVIACPETMQIHQALVVQKVDNAIYWINHYPVDSVVCFVNTYPLDSDLSDG